MLLTTRGKCVKAHHRPNLRHGLQILSGASVSAILRCMGQHCRTRWACDDVASVTTRPSYCTCRLFLSGGLSGAISRTLTSPLERIKLLYQVQVQLTWSPGLSRQSPLKSKLHKIADPPMWATLQTAAVQAIAQATTPSAPLVYSTILQTANKIYRRAQSLRDHSLAACWWLVTLAHDVTMPCCHLAILSTSSVHAAGRRVCERSGEEMAPM